MRACRGGWKGGWIAIVALLACGCDDLDSLRWQARIGDADAQRALAERHAAGDGVDADAAEAQRWYTLAAESGDAVSQLALAGIFAEAPLNDEARSRVWLERAAQNGLGEAQAQLATLLRESGDGREAFEWFLAAATRGHAPAQFAVSESYRLGDGVGVDAAQSLEWLRKSAEGEHAEAQFELGRRYEQGDGVAVDLDVAGDWYHRAAEQGLARAQVAVGKLVAPGQGARWFRLAAQSGDVDGQAQLGIAYDAGRGVSQDPVLAEQWLRLAADAGHALAQNQLGRMYQQGRIARRDPVTEALPQWVVEAKQRGMQIPADILNPIEVTASATQKSSA
jgi:TPR repeat protein